MAVDSTLISGAYKANKPQGVIGNKEIANITGSITKGLNTYMAAVKTKHTVRNAEYDAFSESVLDNSELVGGQYEALYDELSLGKEDFASADKKGRDLQVRDLKAMAGDYADYKALREDVAINKDDLSPAFTNSPEGEMYLDILKGDGKNLIKKDGRIGIEVEGEWKSISSIKQSLDGNKIDTASIDQLEAFRIKTQANDDDFDFDKTRTTLMNSMVSKGKYKSLINDEIIPGRVFRSDLVESLTNKSYSDLGITEEDLLEVEGVDISDGIDAEEAETIATHLEQDEIEMKEVLADYYTTYVGNNGGSSNKINGDTDDTGDYAGGLYHDDGTQLSTGGEMDTMYDDYLEYNSNTTADGLDEDGVFTPDDEVANKKTAQRMNAFRGMLRKGYYNDEKFSDEDIKAYFKTMEGKIPSEVFNGTNFTGWLKDNNIELTQEHLSY